MASALSVRVKVHAGARKEKFEKASDGVFAVAVREKAERNAANARVRTLIARHFKVPATAVRIVAGHHAKSKLLKVIQ